MNGTGLEFRGFKITRPKFTIEVDDLKTELRQPLELEAPSGFGKSSVVRAILGLEEHQGQIRLQGSELNLLPVHKRRIGIVFQDQVLFTHQNAIENVMSGLILQGRRKSDAEALALEGMKKFGIDDRAHARVGELSGGERQRVAILRATLWRPNLLILDEPFQGLDQDHRKQIKNYIAEFLAEHPIPMIWIDHQADVAHVFKGIRLKGERHDRLKQPEKRERRVFHLSES